MTNQSLLKKEANEPCPICEQIGGQCNGSGHVSCGCWDKGVPISSNEADSIAAKSKVSG